MTTERTYTTVIDEALRIEQERLDRVNREIDTIKEAKQPNVNIGRLQDLFNQRVFLSQRIADWNSIK